MRFSNGFTLLCLCCLIVASFGIPVMPSATTSTSAQPVTAPPVPLVPRTVRVAIYNEPNLSAPVYATNPGDIHNNASQLAAMLTSHGVAATLLTAHDIYNHALLTASYDVLALVDNFPRENITNQVREFWLGGGGLLVFDGAAGFLCYFGILPREAAGTDGSPAYWDYVSENITVVTRHPVAKSYANNTLIVTANGYLLWKWSALLGSSIGGDLVRVARSPVDTDSCAVLAYDPSDRGGRIVTLAYDYAYEALPALHPMIVDAVDWLCPRPNGRVVFDLSHQPVYGVDAWDALAAAKPKYTTWRDDLVSRTYTFDKLYPSATGNLTAAHLAPYDLLIIILPQVNFTAAEVTAVTNWIAGGGALLILGDNPGLSTQNGYINYLLSNLALRHENVHVGSTGTTSYFVLHPTTEGCTGLYVNAPGLVNYSAPAYPIWGTNAANALFAGQTYGLGRVILGADINWLDNTFIGNADNEQYAINVVNWLTAASANVLLYTDEAYSANAYRTPVSLALNDLGINYYLTFDADATNQSLHLQPWSLVIIDDANYGAIATLDNDLDAYLAAGGRLLLTTFGADYVAASPIWARLGCTWAATVSSEPPVYIWQHAHDIFTQPNIYGPANFTSQPGYGDDGDRFTVFANATALAGFTSSPAAGQAAIIVRNDGHALLNGYLIDNFFGDLDNSTYPDRLELWENEIVFMVRPACAFAPHVATPIYSGTTLTVTVNVTNLGLGIASGGYVTLSVPAGLGTLLTPATRYFATPLNPGANDTVTWQISVTGAGNYTLSFTAGYNGGWSTTYTVPAFTASVQSLAPPFPTWLLLVVVVIVVVIVVVVVVLLLRKRKTPAK
jgi:hypothetical protein